MSPNVPVNVQNNNVWIIISLNIPLKLGKMQVLVGIHNTKKPSKQKTKYTM